MKKYHYSSEYMKGYQRALKDKSDAESIWDYLNLDRLLNCSEEDIRERARGFRDGQREKNHQKWEYITGYERGLSGKSTAQATGDYLNPQKVLFAGDAEEKARERGFKEGKKEFTENKWL